MTRLQDHADLLRGLADRFRARTPVLIQTEAAECGLACLGMIAGHYGHKVDLAAMRRRSAVSLKGMTLRDLVNVGSDMNLATRALRLELDELRNLRLPCVLHWNHNHFVVLTQVGHYSVTIHDPAIGRRVLPLDQVSQSFTGVALEAWPSEAFEPRNEREAISLLDLVRRTAGIGRAAIQILMISILLEIITIAMPIGFQLVIDEVVVAADFDLLSLIALGLGLLLVMQVLATLARSWATMLFGGHLVLQWKVSLFDQLMRLPLEFFEKRHVGDVVSRFGSLDTIQRTVTTKAITALLDGVMSVALLAMMYIYGGWLVFIAAATVLIYIALRLATYLPYWSMSEEAILFEAQENSHFIESVRGMASLKALNLEQRRRSVWINHLTDRVGARLRIEKFNILFGAAGQTLFGIDRIVMIYLGARAILEGNLSVGMLIAFLSYKDQFASRVNSFIDTAMELRMLSLHGERIADIGLAEPEHGALQKPSSLTLSARNGASSISVRSLRFRYADGEPDIFSNLDFDVRAGECVGIAGPSGAGKSTLLKIMAGLVSPTEGQVAVDGIPLPAMGLHAFRDRVGCVLQDDRLFAGSIAENISGFEPDADPAWLLTCARMAAIDEEILAMPMGFETLVGDMGNSLSGGQRQRIVLARALYRRPGILLLDEATSSLDPDNEARINKAIRQLPMTRVIVAHRPSSLAVAGRLIRLGAPQPVRLRQTGETQDAG
ncbi:ATP-binding cassette subfamily B protein RaxB [Ochrobactrum daejeonense]|uniref:ATP-binding cassette subfamily B protein RaxB n=1 Tax=Brucella daejeonensis TaxID=659015 RepID=A0A7W9B126_9HYPH|nr:peptidase domain-containing ABC transporter [Brucella daejeonensis]MBB5704259.1 ATP-binding cassette subfamily B protein RaxB [Brucella daejeonensis]